MHSNLEIARIESIFINYIQRSKTKQMWFLNYCAPFIFSIGTSTTTNRIIMYSAILVLFLVYLIHTVLYRFLGETTTQPRKFQKQHEGTLKRLTRIRFCNQEAWISSKQYKEWYLGYYGMHSVATGLCIMYSPYMPQLIFVLIHMVLFIAATILRNWVKIGSKSVPQIIYIVLMVISQILNIMLLFSGAMGVGASGFDENAKICLLQSGQPNTDL